MQKQEIRVTYEHSKYVLTPELDVVPESPPRVPRQLIQLPLVLRKTRIYGIKAL